MIPLKTNFDYLLDEPAIKDILMGDILPVHQSLY